MRCLYGKARIDQRMLKKYGKKKKGRVQYFVNNMGAGEWRQNVPELADPRVWIPPAPHPADVWIDGDLPLAPEELAARELEAAEEMDAMEAEIAGFEVEPPLPPIEIPERALPPPRVDDGRMRWDFDQQRYNRI